MTTPSPAAVAAAVEHCRERMKQYWESPDIDRDKLKTILAALAAQSEELANHYHDFKRIRQLMMCDGSDFEQLESKWNSVQAELAQARKDVERLDKQLGKFTEVNHQPDRVIDPIAYAAMQQEQKTTVPLCPACQSPLLHESFQLYGTWLKVIRAYCVNKRCPSESARDGAAGMTPDEAMRFLIQVVNQDLRWQKQTTPPEGPAPAPTSQ